MFRVHDTTAKTGRYAADFLSLVHPDRLKQAGVTVAMFYTKNATKEAIDAYHKAGISVVLIHEAGATSGLQGAATGAAHGVRAALAAMALGYPTDVPIIAASAGDYDNTPATLKASVEYWTAFAKAAHPYAVGCYGDWDLLDKVGDWSALNVQAAAKGWSWLLGKWRGPHRTAHMVQKPSSQIAPTGAQGFPGVRVDLCEIVRPFRAWFPVPPAPKPAVPVLVVPKASLKLLIPNIKSSDVVALRKILRFFGWMKQEPSNVFDRDTKAGVVNMQRALKVTADGWYGPETRDALVAFLAALGKL